MANPKLQWQDLVDDYVAGQLNEPELSAFEDAMFEDSQLLAEVEQLQMLKKGLALQPDMEAISAPAAQPSRRPVFLRLGPPFLALAAGVLIGLSLDIGNRKRALDVLPSQVISAFRSDQAPVERIHFLADLHLLFLQIQPQNPQAVQWQIENLAGEPVLSGAGLQQAQVCLVLQRRDFPPGTYFLRVWESEKLLLETQLKVD